jgi:hypothetical protein
MARRTAEHEDDVPSTCLSATTRMAAKVWLAVSAVRACGVVCQSHCALGRRRPRRTCATDRTTQTARHGAWLNLGMTYVRATTHDDLNL